MNHDGIKHPLPDPDENKEVQYPPTFHQYRVGYLPDADLHPDNQEQIVMELGVMGSDGFLLTCITPVPTKPGWNMVVFCRTGIKIPKPPKPGTKLHIPQGPRGF